MDRVKMMVLCNLTCHITYIILAIKKCMQHRYLFTYNTLNSLVRRSQVSHNPLTPWIRVKWKQLAERQVTWICHHEKIWLWARETGTWHHEKFMLEAEMMEMTYHECTQLMESDKIQWAFRKGLLHDFHQKMSVECTICEPWLGEHWSHSCLL